MMQERVLFQLPIANIFPIKLMQRLFTFTTCLFAVVPLTELNNDMKSFQLITVQ